MVSDEATLSLTPRTSKSTEIARSLEFSGWEVPDDEPRPVTAVESLAKPPSRAGRKPSAVSSSRPGGPQLDGWGDVDADRFFQSNEEVFSGPDDDVDVAARRGSRLEALAKHINKPLPVYTRVPSRQAIRQRSLAVMELAPPEGISDSVLQSPPKTMMRKPLITHRRRESSDSDDSKLPTIKKGSASQAIASTKAHTTLVPRTAGLFGPHIDDSLEMRAVVFQRFLPVWSLMPSRPAGHEVPAAATQGSPTRSSSASTVAKDTKSPIECSMVLTKICKAIGISLSTSPAPDVWRSSKRRGSTTTATMTSKTHGDVDLDTFCEFVVRNALQPAMHHFRLDRDGHEYLHTIDAVVHSLVTRMELSREPQSSTTSLQAPWRLRELNELQPVLPPWKKGILAVQKQMPLVKTSPSASAFLPTDSSVSEDAGPGNDPTMYSLIQTNGCDAPTGLSYSRKLPASEARATQDANIRRKIQLRKSWQPRIVVSDPLVQGPPGQSNGLDTVADATHDASLGSCIRVEAVQRPLSTDFTPSSNDPSNNQDTESTVRRLLHTEESPRDDPPVLLLCGSCPGEREATLWCSSCFAVYCSECWTVTHHSTVDLQATDNQHELPGPTARPMRTQRDALAPPVAMLYLPTKPLASGRLMRGPSTSQFHAPKFSTNQCDESEEDEHQNENEQRLLATAISSHTILPALKPARHKPRGLEKATSLHHSMPALDTVSAPRPSAMDSTANLLKALMLGTASSASVLGTTSSGSPWSSSSETRTREEHPLKRASHDPTRGRKKLQPKAVTLDAATLFAQ